MEPTAGVPLVLCDDQYQAPVHVSAGGFNYTTTLATLTRYPESKLAKLFNGTLPIPLDPVNHHYFLDMDGNVFTHVLNFLRYGKLVLPDNFDQLPLLLEEAQTLEIEPLIDQLKTISEEETDEGKFESSESEESASSNKKIKRTKPKLQGRKREWIGRKEMDNLFRRLGESFEGLIKELEQIVRKGEKTHEGVERLVISIIDSLQRLLVENERKMDTLIIKENHTKNTKDDERMYNLMKGLVECIQGLLIENNNTLEKIINVHENRNVKENGIVDTLLKSFKECFKSLLVDNQRTMEKIIEEHAAKMQRDDERLDNLMQKLGNNCQGFLISNNSKMDTKMREYDEKVLTADKQINKLVKGLEECFQRLLDNSDKKFEFSKMQAEREISQIVSTPARKAGVISIRVGKPFYGNVLKNRHTSERSFGHSCHIHFVSYPNMPQLVQPSNALLIPTPEGKQGFCTWQYTYSEGVENITFDIANITTQLIDQGYKMVTANITEHLVPPCSYVFIRSSK